MIVFIGTYITIQVNYTQLYVTAHNQLMSIWLAPFLNLPFCVTDLVLIYEKVTSSASTVRWLTLHSWTLNSLTNAERRTTAHSRMNWTNSFITSGRIEYTSRSPRLAASLLFCLFVATGTWLQNRCPAMDYSASICCLPNRCLSMVIFVTI
jgi:hypothetical protein